MVDRRLSYVGSLNVLSNSESSGELMVAIPGEKFAERLMSHQGASVFAAGATVCERHDVRRHARRGESPPVWRWLCTACPPSSQRVIRFPNQS